MKLLGRELTFNNNDIWHKGNFDPASKVDKVEFDNLEIGGRNLALIRDYSHDNQYQTVTKTDETFNGQPVYRAIKKITGTPPTSIGSITIRKGETFTASIWIKHEQQPTLESARLMFYKNTTLKSVSAKNNYGEWERLIVTYTNNTDADIENVSINFYPARGVGEVTYFTCPQIERGNKVTDWTPAPEDIQAEIDSKAPLASPAFTGTPTAPTAPNGTNTNQIATTKFVQNALSASGYGDMLKSQYDTDSDGIVDRAETADKLTTARTISLSGDIVGNAIFDGSADISINTTRLIKNNSFILDSLYTFTRSSTAYLSDGTLVNMNLPRFEQGKFGKAIMVEEGTENIIPIADWNAQNGWALVWGTQTRTIETTGRLFNGVNIIKSVIESTGQAVIYKDFAVSTTPGVVYTISAFVKSQGRPVRIWCHDRSDNGQVYSSPNVPGTDFTRLTVQFTTTGTGYCRVHFFFPSGNVGDIVWITAPQLEQKPYATSFIDGTRAAETLTIPTAGVLNPQEGTVECWVMAQDSYVRRRDIFTVNEPVATQDRIILGYNVTGTGLELNWRPANAAQFFIRATDISSDTDWVHVGFRYKWNGTGYDLALIYNGRVVSAGIATNGQMTNLVKVFLGCTKNGSIYTYFANMLFDDLRISNRARTDAEILAVYQSGQPLPYDANTTWLSRFDCYNTIDRPTGIKISVGNTTPEYPVINDIWIDTN